MNNVYEAIYNKFLESDDETASEDVRQYYSDMQNMFEEYLCAVQRDMFCKAFEFGFIKGIEVAEKKQHEADSERPSQRGAFFFVRKEGDPMATIQASIQLHDGMSNVLHNIYSSVNTVISVFEDMQRETGQAVNIARLQEARESLNQVGAAARQIDDRIQEAARSQQNFNDRLHEGRDEANGLLAHVKQFAGAYLGIQGIKMGARFVADTISLQNVQTEAETKPQGIMQQRMGASPEAIQSIKDLTSAQQRLGVVGDEVQLMGAQQLATFLNSGAALETLIPAMNNLAVQQNGAAVSAEAMTNIGNMMGKAMQGQVGALTRVGVTFTEAQEKVLKYGNEQERAATLAEVITDNVGNMNAIIAATPQGQIQQIANAWCDIKEVVGARLYLAVLKLFQAFNANMPQAETLVMGIAGALSVVTNVLSWVVDGVGAVAGFFQSNWSIIEPVIWGVVAALTAYGAYLAITNGLELVSKGIKMASIIAQYAYAAATGAVVAADTAATAAQMGLNTALLACPLTWIIILIIALVAAFYAIIAAVNHFTGSSISATGVIAGAFAMLGANIMNLFVIPARNIIADFINFFANVFHDPVAAVKILFLDLAETVIGYISNMAHTIEDVINKIPGVTVDITSGLDGFQNDIKSMADKVKSESEWKEVVAHKEYIDPMEAGKAGYNAGKGFEDRMKGAFDGLKGPGGGMQDTWEGIGNNTGATAGNTAKMADSMDILDEELKYMRDAAEQEIINRFTLADMKIDISNSNTLTTKTDFDDVNRMFGDVTAEALATMAEGAYA